MLSDNFPVWKKQQQLQWLLCALCNLSTTIPKFPSIFFQTQVLCEKKSETLIHWNKYFSIHGTALLFRNVNKVAEVGASSCDTRCQFFIETVDWVCICQKHVRIGTCSKRVHAWRNVNSSLYSGMSFIAYNLFTNRRKDRIECLAE